MNYYVYKTRLPQLNKQTHSILLFSLDNMRSVLKTKIYLNWAFLCQLPYPQKIDSFLYFNISYISVNKQSLNMTAQNLRLCFVKSPYYLLHILFFRGFNINGRLALFNKECARNFGFALYNGYIIKPEKSDEYLYLTISEGCLICRNIR